MNRSIEHWNLEKHAVCSENGATAAQHHLAAKAGASILHKGGNAIDAAVATAFALAAVEPWMCGLGGSGFMVIWRAGEKRADVIDFQGTLPQGIRLDDYPIDENAPETTMGFPGVIDQRNILGPLSITVPGAVRGLSHAMERYGTLGLDSVLEPAIRLARRGLPVDWFANLQISLAAADLARDPEASKTYLKNGAPLAPEQFVQLGKLAKTLEDLANDGPEGFYGGVLGEKLAGDLEALGSRITLDDLKAYKVIEHQGLATTHRGAVLHTAGETSGGPRLIETLRHIEGELDTSAGIGGESWKIYADGLNKAWRSHKSRIGRTPENRGCTSHLSTVDAEGNMAALTYTLLNRFGSCVMLPNTGILMNNSVSYFDMRPGFPTTMEGGKRINASNMCPTIATRDDQAIFAIGASGANHIQPCVTQIAALMLDFGLTLEEAFNHPRIHAADTGSIRVDPRLGDEVLAHLEKHFELEIEQLLVFPKLYSCPSGVARDPKTGMCSGINDPSQPVGSGAIPAPLELSDAPGTPHELRP